MTVLTHPRQHGRELARSAVAHLVPSVFCDWLTIYQQHLGDISSVPTLNGGRVIKLRKPEGKAHRKFSFTDEHGELYQDLEMEFTSAAAFDFEGSYDTHLQIKSDGGRVSLSGNIGRFERSDNVFGYSVADCIRIANRLMVRLGLPEFTGRPVPAGYVAPSTFDEIKESNGSFYARQDSAMKTGALITRIDLTKNYLCGSQDNAGRLMHYLAGMHRRNKAAKAYPNGVTWGEGSKFWYGKMYNKGKEMQKDKHADPALLESALNAGLVRDEISLKTRFLTQNGLSEIGRWTNGDDMENVIYGKFSSVLTQMEVSTDDFESIPGRLGEIAIAWRNGVDMKTRLPRNTFYRYRKQLKSHGIDISERCDVSKLNMRCEVIRLQEVYPSDSYFLPQAA